MIQTQRKIGNAGGALFMHAPPSKCSSTRTDNFDQWQKIQITHLERSLTGDKPPDSRDNRCREDKNQLDSVEQLFF